ncbi:type II secretion system protein [Telluria beijingensis]|uniref:type II secretion system protein n=1 Tax=Telluria beijingensis TaxID=3068633 RepID=UPI002795830F|nr:prepilin-type N-terminal cleavage/methylation domain-containing protein [Massilia sp. REN29]
MTTSFKRAAAAGFTLIELLIVVIILAIISAIAIPQFSAATSDAQQSAADANLAAVRNAIELYRAQHAGNVYPGLKASSGGADCTGVKGTGELNTEQAFKDQLTYASNKDGQTCSIADDNFRYGPYLRQGIPVDPFGNSADVAIQTTGANLVADAAATAKGWKFDTKSGQFILNKAADQAPDAGN